MSRIPTRDYGHTAEDEYQELMANQLLPPPPALTRNNARDFDDDCEELLANQLLQLPTQPPRLCRTASVAFNEDDACIFALKQQQRRSPVEVHTGSPPKPQTLVDIVAENPHRAIVSRDYCGNL
jgi:hypothetical protein